MMKSISTACVLALLIAGGASAQTGGASYLAPPEPQRIGSPIYPRDAIGEEAWVELSFTVRADGTTADIVAIDGFYSPPFERATLAAAKNWRFKPGTDGGKAIDWHNYRVNVPYAFVDVDAAVYPEFAGRYSKIVEFLEQKQFVAARSEIREAFDRRAVKLLYEYAMIEIALYKAETGLGNRLAAYKAIRRATPPLRIKRREQQQQPDLGSRINTRVQLSASSTLLPDSTLKNALRDRFAAEAVLGLYLDALQTYERLAKMETIAASDPIARQAQLIRNALASDSPLGVAGKIQDGVWATRPTRRMFTFADVKGTIDRIRISCTGHNATLPFQPGVDWTMPASWGDCDLEVFGSEGAEFTFVQSGDSAQARLETATPLTVIPPDDQFRMPSTVDLPGSSSPPGAP